MSYSTITIFEIACEANLPLARVKLITESGNFPTPIGNNVWDKKAVQRWFKDCWPQRLKTQKEGFPL